MGKSEQACGCSAVHVGDARARHQYPPCVRRHEDNGAHLRAQIVAPSTFAAAREVPRPVGNGARADRGTGPNAYRRRANASMAAS